MDKLFIIVYLYYTLCIYLSQMLDKLVYFMYNIPTLKQGESHVGPPIRL